jgi:aconitate hydratase
MSHNLFSSLQEFNAGQGTGKYYSLRALETAGVGKVSRLPVSIRIVLESVLRNCDGKKVAEEHVRQLANWAPKGARTDEIPFVVARVVLQDFTGVPLLADLAAMRNVANDMGRNPKVIEPLVPVDLVVDHSVMIDHYGTRDALDLNMKLEFSRNNERYEFMKWGMQAFDTFGVVPPGIGIVHQVNLEYLARGVHQKDGIYYPDTLVGHRQPHDDDQRYRCSSAGVWAASRRRPACWGSPVYFLTPDVVGVELKGKLNEGITATDLVLTVTELLRREKVVGKFVEFFGEGTASLAVPDRATIANMAPEYGATMGFFPVDEATVDYLMATGRTQAEVDAFTAYFKAQGLFGVPRAGEIDYTSVVTLDLTTIKPSVAGPKRPQDRIELGNLKVKFTELFSKPIGENGFAKKAEDLAKRITNGARSRRRGCDQRRVDAGPIQCTSRPGGDGRQPPYARPLRRAGWQAHFDRQRRRADRCDHVVHQHVESRRAARGGPARQEGGRARPEGEAPHQDFAGAGLARGDRLPDQGRAAAVPRAAWFREWPLMAARRASAMRATWRRNSTMRS